MLVEIDRGTEDRKVEKLDRNAPHYLPSVVVSEFYAGIHLKDSGGTEKAERLLGNAQEIGMEGRIARKAGELIARKKKDDLSANLNDLYIVATAIVKDEKILTLDTEDFRGIEEAEYINWENY